MANEVNEHRWLWTIFSLYFLLAFGYSLLMPIWEAPDEPAHYHIAWHLASRDKYPTQRHNYEAHQPRTYYYLASWVLRGINEINPQYTAYYVPHEYKHNIRVPERRFDWNEENYRFWPGVYLLRWINIMFGALALRLNWKAFQQIVPEKSSLRLAALALSALTPQYLHIMSSISNDALGTLAGASLFYLAIKAAKEPSTHIVLLSIILAFLLPFITKLTLLPVSAALLIVVAGSWFFKMRRKRRLVISAALILFGAIVLYLLFPASIQSAANEINWRLFSLHKNAQTEKYLKFISSQIVWTYWGKVGWLAVGLPLWIIRSLTTLGLLGMLINAVILARGKLEKSQRNLWLIVWLVALFTIAAVLRNGLTTSATQGRLLFPAIGALSLLMVSGWHYILSERMQNRLPILVTLAMTACNLILWLTGILPTYFQPLLD